MSSDDAVLRLARQVQVANTLTLLRLAAELHWSTEDTLTVSRALGLPIPPITTRKETA